MVDETRLYAKIISWSVLASAVGVTKFISVTLGRNQLMSWRRLLFLARANVCVAVLLGYVLRYQPALWSALVLPLLGAIGTGGVSLVDDRLQKMKESPQG